MVSGRYSGRRLQIVTMLCSYGYMLRAAGKLLVFDMTLNQVDGILDDAESNCRYFLDGVMCQYHPGKFVILLWI